MMLPIASCAKRLSKESAYTIVSNMKLNTARLSRLQSWNASNCRFFSRKRPGAPPSSRYDANQRSALVVGCNGALGSAITRHFVNTGLIDRVIGADVRLPTVDEPLHHFITMSQRKAAALPAEKSAVSSSEGSGQKTASSSDLQLLCNSLLLGMKGVDDLDNRGEEIGLDAVICAAGGWMPTKEYAPPDFAVSVDKMLQQNLYPVLAATQIAAMRLKSRGLFVIIGAAAALAPTPGMLGYGISKAAVHHVVHTLGGKHELRHPTEELSVVGILPSILDTPSNREKFPSDSDYTTWTKTEEVAGEIGEWITTPDLRPHSGSLVKVFPRKGGTSVFRLVR